MKGPRAPRLGSIRAISLDLDDTLWAVGPVIQRAEQAVLEWFKARYPAIGDGLDIGRMRQVRAEIAAEHPDHEHDFSFLRRSALARHVAEAGYPTDVADAAFEVFMTVRNQVTIYADVAPALQRLGRRFPLVGLTNGNACLRRIGLDDAIRRCVTAGQVGYAKPHPAIFEAAARALGVTTDALLHVGDDPLFDVQGAQTAGVTAVWINRQRRDWPEGQPRPAAEVGDLLELAGLLGL